MKNKSEKNSDSISDTKNLNSGRFNKTIFRKTDAQSHSQSSKFKTVYSPVLTLLQKKLRIIQYDQKRNQISSNPRHTSNSISKKNYKMREVEGRALVKTGANRNKSKSLSKINSMMGESNLLKELKDEIRDFNQGKEQGQLIQGEPKTYESIKSVIEQLHRKSSSEFLKDSHKSLVIKSNSKIKLVLKGKRKGSIKPGPIFNPELAQNKSRLLEDPDYYQILPSINRKSIIDKKKYVEQYKVIKDRRQQISAQKADPSSQIIQIKQKKLSISKMKTKPNLQLTIPKKPKNHKQTAEVVIPDEIDGWFDEGEGQRSNNEECEQFDKFMIDRKHSSIEMR